MRFKPWRSTASFSLNSETSFFRPYTPKCWREDSQRREERHCAAPAYAATTEEDNAAALALFRSMGYSAYRWEALDGRTRRVLLKATCGYDDDVILIKGADPRELAAFRSRAEPDLKSVRQEDWAKASPLQIDEVSGPKGEGLGLGSINNAVGTAAFSKEARRAMSSSHSLRGLIQ
ncbi:MAG: hypothetical protein JZD41_04600 [Thermoproteus sp.]|nr:hypothetical protein [Thermoproteus sp.]